jgi:hypothetical protein
LEGVEVVVEAAEYYLEHTMELMQCKSIRQANEAPDWRSDRSHGDPKQKLHRLAALPSYAKATRLYLGARLHRAQFNTEAHPRFFSAK